MINKLEDLLSLAEWKSTHTVYTVYELELRKCKFTIIAELINTTGQKLTAW